MISNYGCYVDSTTNAYTIVVAFDVSSSGKWCTRFQDWEKVAWLIFSWESVFGDMLPCPIDILAETLCAGALVWYDMHNWVEHNALYCLQCIPLDLVLSFY